MADNKDGVKLYITYKNNQATVEIEEDGVRRPHDAKYQNTDKKDKYDY